jgi:glycosyltransferase involved in cell wall biosynthesis
MATILIVSIRVPFTRGGADALCGSLAKELKNRGHDVDLVELPISFQPKEDLLNHAAMWRALPFESFGDKKVDLVIATKFPSYYIQHPKKSIWLVHQHRPIYELFGSRYSDFSDDPRDEQLRQMLVDGDNRVIGEAQYVAGISKNVIDRLAHYNGVKGEVLYPPLPLGTRYREAESEDYILSVGRICNIKRIDMMVKALPMVHQFVKLKIAGVADEPGVMDYLQNEIAKHHLGHRVEFLGRVSDEELIDLYSKALVTYYAPFDEDYGYVTLESFASGKPVLTAHDSGGVLEFVKHEENGLIVEPTLDAISKGMNRLIEDKAFARQLGSAGKKFIASEGLATAGWEKVVSGLLSPLQPDERGNEQSAVA